MRIKRFAERTKLSPKTIRYYEEIGLLPAPSRLENGYRDYGEADVARARLVAGARRLDFSLVDIQEILDLRDQRIGQICCYLGAQKDNPVFQQPAINIVNSLFATTFFDNVRYQRHVLMSPFQK